MAEAEGGKNWLRCGCLGCLGLFVVSAVLAGVLLAIVYIGSRPEQAEDQRSTPPIPLSAEAGDPAAQPGEIGAAVGGLGRVVLDVSEAELNVEPAAPGEPLSVQARYDREFCELEESLETADDSDWLYHLSFRCSSGSFLQNVRQMLSGTKPRVRVFLPADALLRLEVFTAKGGTQMQLGGLWLSELSLKMEMGGVELGFDQPLKKPMERLEIRGSMGGLSAGLVGNASPRELVVDYSMGGMELDLNGLWLQDSDIEIRFRMGGGAVLLPDDVRVEGVPTDRRDPAEDPEIPVPTLRFSTTSDMGELTIVD